MAACLAFLQGYAGFRHAKFPSKLFDQRAVRRALMGRCGNSNVQLTIVYTDDATGPGVDLDAAMQREHVPVPAKVAHLHNAGHDQRRQVRRLGQIGDHDAQDIQQQQDQYGRKIQAAHWR